MNSITEPTTSTAEAVKSVNGSAVRMRIGLLGPYGFGNLGDAAIQDAIIKQTKKYCREAQIHGFSQNPHDTAERHNIPSFLISSQQTDAVCLLNRIPSGLRHKLITRTLVRLFVKIPNEVILIIRSFVYLKGFNLLIASGGGQLDDYWGGALGHPYALFKWAMIARMRKTEFMFVSVGAGPIDSWLSRLLIRLALSLASYRSYRDEDSKRFINGIGFKRDDPVYPDMAFSLQIEEPHQRRRRTSPFPVVGIGPMAYFDPRVWPERNIDIYEAYLKKLARFAEWLILSGYPVVLFPGEAVQDRFAIDDFKAILRQGVSPSSMQQVEDRPIVTVDELTGQLSETDLVVASRFHGVVLPLLVNKPVLALSYHPKINMLMKDVGLGEYCLPIDSFDLETLKDRFKALESNEATLRKQIKTKVEEYKRALDDQYVRLFKSA